MIASIPAWKGLEGYDALKSWDAADLL